MGVIDQQGNIHAGDGKFSVKPAGENGATITAEPTQGELDDDAMDQVALMLGTSPEWDSPSDYLEDIANLVGTSGRPHPGDADPDEYRGEMAAFRANHHTTQVSATSQQLDGLALLLGTNPEWHGADYLEDIANVVARSGRPHPGDCDPGAYRAQIIGRQVDRGTLTSQAARSELTDTMSENIVDWAQMGCVNTWAATPVQDAAGTWSYSPVVTGSYIDPAGNQDWDESSQYDLSDTPGAIVLEQLARCAPAGEPLSPLVAEITGSD